MFRKARYILLKFVETESALVIQLRQGQVVYTEGHRQIAIQIPIVQLDLFLSLHVCPMCNVFYVMCLHQVFCSVLNNAQASID